MKRIQQFKSQSLSSIKIIASFFFQMRPGELNIMARGRVIVIKLVLLLLMGPCSTNTPSSEWSNLRDFTTGSF